MKKIVGDQHAALLLLELTVGDSKRKKIALQDLCALYRKEHVLQSVAANKFETVINGIILQSDQDLKVVRWCLNALAQFGSLANCRPYIEAALNRHAGDPEIEAAGVAALCRLFNGSTRDIASLNGIDPVVWKLAALQNTDPSKIDLKGLSIDIETVDPAILRLALITVGLNKDIENLFHPRHSNGEFVRRLGQHDDHLVQQYSVWAVIENRRLGFSDVGISIENIAQLKPNVQSKAYQLVAERDPDYRRRREITEAGSMSGPSDAREGLAKGIKSNYYSELEDVTIPWFRRESEKSVKQSLAEHFARFSDECNSYKELAMEINVTDENLRERLLMGAEGTRLFSELKAARPANLFSGFDPADDIMTRLRNQSAAIVGIPRIKILFLSAAPTDKASLRLDKELREIEDGIKTIVEKKRDLIITQKHATRALDILPSLLDHTSDVIHFSGHGTADGLSFEDENGREKIINPDNLAAFIKGIGSPVKCAVFNACFTDGLYAKIAPYIEIAIGYRDELDDEAAIAFSRAFYQSLAAGQSYVESFNLALTQLRVAGFKEDAEKYTIRVRTRNLN
jgi:hypothetical protein